jgi:hypothetical protein
LLHFTGKFNQYGFIDIELHGCHSIPFHSIPFRFCCLVAVNCRILCGSS